MIEQQPARAAPGKTVVPPQSDYLGGTEMTVSDAPQIASVLLMLARWGHPKGGGASLARVIGGATV
jgi:hypothetical protein